MATDVSSAANLIRSDVSKQLELSMEMANELAGIDAAIATLKASGVSLEAIKPLEERRNKLVHIAQSLANNANQTSNSAIKIISAATARSTTT